MSIARVRIAPVDRWCRHNVDLINENPQIAERSGQFILIDTSWVDASEFCDGKVWKVETQHAIETREKLGFTNYCPEYFVCEHILEMD